MRNKKMSVRIIAIYFANLFKTNHRDFFLWLLTHSADTRNIYYYSDTTIKMRRLIKFQSSNALA